ncbi:MAG: methylenetetrahydrofolate reductase C-terminal domain-containing protein [Thermodesulfobacteriota bacterium]
MIRSITKQKSQAEIMALLNRLERIFIFGCGTCVTLCRTGGAPEVQEMAGFLREAGKLVTGSIVLPVACDEISHEAVDQMRDPISQAQVALVMTCAFGVQTLGRQIQIPVVPALDTLFMGKERGVGLFEEICTQCGDCILGDTGGICPVTSCHKGLVNGPCGGTKEGKCEIDPDKDCAWSLIYQRLKEQGRLDRMRKLQPPRNNQVSPRPGKIRIPVEERGE